MMNKYRSQYRYFRQDGMVRHFWEVVGAFGGVHLHITDMGEEHQTKRYHGGIEIHRRQPLPGDLTAPTHDECWLLKCPCWHEGSSLAASEHWIPMWLVDPHDHDRMFRALEAFADRTFEVPVDE